MFKQHKKWLIFLLVVAAATTGGAVYYYRASTPVITQATTIVGRGNIQSVVSATGTITAVNSVAVGSRVPGLITEVRVQENDRVKKGQVLVVLDDTAIRAQVEQFQAQVANFAAIYDRSKKLFAIGGEAAQQLDSDRMNYLMAEANYNNYSAQLAYYVITAPIDGMVVGAPADVGSTVVQGMNTAQTVLTIAQMDKMQIKVLVDESDIGKVKAGQQVSFTVDAYDDRTFTGKVTKISRSATISSNVVYYPVYVDVDSAGDLLYPTMTAGVTITVAERQNVLTVPLTAVKEEGGQKYVQVLAGGKSQNTPVKIGLSDDRNIEILSGLKEGALIVVPSAAKKATTNKDQGPPPMI